MRTKVPGRLEGEFECGTLVRLWACDGKHRIERVGERTIFSLGLSQGDLDERTVEVFTYLCSACGQRVDRGWEFTPAPRDRMLCPECAVKRQRNLAKDVHRMLGDSEYLVVRIGDRETLYPIGTPSMVFAALEDAAHGKMRVKVAYGDPITGRDWQDEFETSGYVERTAKSHVALLVHNARSMGGSLLRADHLVQIKAANGGRVLYEHPHYHRAEG